MTPSTSTPNTLPDAGGAAPEQAARWSADGGPDDGFKGADRLCLAPRAGTPFWPAAVQALGCWAGTRAVPLRELLVLLPQLNPVVAARRAFAGAGGWQPRIETAETLAQSLGPGEPAAPATMSDDDCADRLQLAMILRAARVPEAARLADARLLDAAVDAVRETARALRRVAQAQPPAAREAYWGRARALVRQSAGPGAVEAWLACVALEWAVSAPAPATDRLFALRPAGAAIVVAGGIAPLAAGLARHWIALGVRVAWLDADVDAAAPFDGWVGAQAAPDALSHAVEIVAADAEAEAWAAARAALDALARHPAGQVALVAQDRERVRRCCALLARAGVPVLDETGWRLSTTRAAARVMAWLRVLRDDARRDDWLAWLKSDPALAGDTDSQTDLAHLERLWRGGRADGDEARRALAFETAARARVQASAPRASRPLAEWQAALGKACRIDDGSSRDAAEQAVAEALRLGGPRSSDPTWAGLARQTRMTLAEFSRWVDVALEAASFRPPADGGGPAPRVVVTPLAQLPLRPFVAAICPGADERRLGAAGARAGLLGDALARELGLPDAAERQRCETLAFAHLLGVPELRFVRARADGSEPLAASLLLQRLEHDARGQGRAGLARVEDAPALRPLRARPVARPQPIATDALPSTISASQAVALRDCPYLYFAQAVLRLRDTDELDDAIDKRDYGSWLHAVLYRFHSGRERPFERARDLEALRQAAQAARDEAGLGAAELLPFESGFEGFAARYLDWQQRSDEAGWLWQVGELSRSVPLRGLPDVALIGRIDRVDERAGARRIVDYKTGSSDRLSASVRTAAEETQLAFYAALLGGDDGALPPVDAAFYLAVEERPELRIFEHPSLQQGARMLQGALAQAIGQARAGVPLRALGEAPACDHCDARGLCRRDHWPAGSQPRVDPPAGDVEVSR